jgi:beta-glucuronidase
MTGPKSEKETYAFQEVYTRDVLKVVGHDPTLSGAIYWTLREFAVKPHWDGGAQRVGVERDAIHNKGLITYDGRPKPAWNVLRDDIRTTPLKRPEADVALALGTRVPVKARGRIGGGLAIAILAAVAAFVVLDIWAFAGWRRASLEDEREARAEALRRRRPVPAPALAEDDEPARLRLIA